MLVKGFRELVFKGKFCQPCDNFCDPVVGYLRKHYAKRKKELLIRSVFSFSHNVFSPVRKIQLVCINFILPSAYSFKQKV